MNQTNRWAVGIMGGTFFVITCLFMAASGRFTSEAVAVDGTLTPTAWCYLPYVSRCELPAPSSTPIQTPEPTPTPTQTPDPTPATGGIVVDHRHVDADSIPQNWLDQTRSLDVFFAHKSIGYNIMDGFADLEALDPTRYTFDIEYNASASWFDTHNGIAHRTSGFGSNLDPFSKTAGFDDLIRNSGYHAADVAMMKYCYGDFDPWVSISTQQVWENYRDTIESLEQDYPDTLFVWWTAPVIVPSYDRGNDEKAVFNGLVRDYCAARDDCVLFDLADIESHDPSGNPVIGPAGYPALYAGYSDDFAHLNEAGRQRAARAMWWLLARIAGWDGL